MVPAVSASLPGGERRRRDDRRIDELVTSVASLTTQTALVAQNVSSLTAKVDQVGKTASEASDRLANVSSDASASPAGRELLRRVEASEVHHNTQDKRLDGLEDAAIAFRGEVKGALFVTKALASITTFLAAAMALAYYVEVIAHGKVSIP